MRYTNIEHSVQHLSLNELKIVYRKMSPNAGHGSGRQPRIMVLSLSVICISYFVLVGKWRIDSKMHTFILQLFMVHLVHFFLLFSQAIKRQFEAFFRILFLNANHFHIISTNWVLSTVYITFSQA